MVNKEILNKIKEEKAGIKKVQESIKILQNDIIELCEEICKNINYEDLRPMEKDDIVVGQRFFGENDEGFYTLVVERVLGFDDLDFKAFVADGCRYGIFKHFVLKDTI